MNCCYLYTASYNEMKYFLLISQSTWQHCCEQTPNNDRSRFALYKVFLTESKNRRTSSFNSLGISVIVAMVTTRDTYLTQSVYQRKIRKIEVFFSWDTYFRLAFCSTVFTFICFNWWNSSCETYREFVTFARVYKILYFYIKFSFLYKR